MKLNTNSTCPLISEEKNCILYFVTPCMRRYKETDCLENNLLRSYRIHSVICDVIIFLIHMDVFTYCEHVLTNKKIMMFMYTYKFEFSCASKY